jgi:predicted XRE-type DNA-binding protein
MAITFDYDIDKITLDAVEANSFVKIGGTSGQFLKADGTVDSNTYLTSFTEVNDLTVNVTWDIVPDAYISQSSVTQHQAALTLTQSQISDLNVLELSSFSVTSNPASGGGTLLYDNAGTFTYTPPDLSIFLTDAPSDGNPYARQNGTWTQVVTNEVNDLTAAVTWANVPDAFISQSSVTQHQTALSITESQISDLQNYLTDITTQTDPKYLRSDENDTTTGTLTAQGYIKSAATSDDILLGDGTTTSLAGLSSSVGSIDDLTDVDTTTTAPVDGQVLVWNGTTSEWEPGENGPQVYLQSTEPTDWSVGDFWIKT